MDTLAGIFFVLFLLSGFVSTPYLFMIKSELKSKGKETTYLVFIPSDITKFRKLIKEEKNPVIKSKYREMFNYFWISSIINIISFTGLVVSNLMELN